MVVIVIRYKKMSSDVSWRILLLACVPQFDTMHPSVTLGAKFNDRNIACVGNNNLGIPKHSNT